MKDDKKGLEKDMTNFLQMPNKLFSKKRRQINKSKQKANIGQNSLRKTIISSLENFDKKELPVFIPTTKTSKAKAKNINIPMIDANAYCAACCLKRAQIFTISIKNIQYQVEKEARAKTDPKSVIPQK